MSFIDHKITVNKRILKYQIPRRNDESSKALGRRKFIRYCIACIRRLQNSPTSKDLYENPAHSTIQES
ncbi:hypothetical protein LCGC14_1130260 [marine sediment metagenome]|uniref:Uncharacterized protein n=1 Tax=marine sediment metagenome TaxID=412755 RepID=A0A0F9M184_9ZZZZ